MSQQLDVSLGVATSALIQAARIREVEQQKANGVVADAVDELHIPDRSLFLFDADGRPIKPIAAPDWVTQAAREAMAAGRADGDLATRADHTVWLPAGRV